MTKELLGYSPDGIFFWDWTPIPNPGKCIFIREGIRGYAVYSPTEPDTRTLNLSWCDTRTDLVDLDQF